MANQPTAERLIPLDIKFSATGCYRWPTPRSICKLEVIGSIPIRSISTKALQQEGFPFERQSRQRYSAGGPAVETAHGNPSIVGGKGMTGLMYAQRDPRVRKREPELAPEAEPEAEPNPVLLLQQAAGNGAVSRLLQRDALSMRDPTPLGSPAGGVGGLGSAGGLGPGLSIDPNFVAKRQEEIRGKVTAYLGANEPVVQGKIAEGVSMAELVDLVRTNVPEAREMAPEQIAGLLRKWSKITIAEHRLPTDQKGAESEALAAIKNALGKVPTEAKLERSGAFVKVSLSGLEAGYERDEDTKATVGTASGKDVAVNLAARGVHFAGKVEPGSGADPTKWELGITFPGDDMVPLIPSLGQVFGSASSAVGQVASDVKAGRTSVGAVKKQFEPVKGAVDALSGIAGHSRVSVGVKVEGEGPEIKATATLTVSF